MCKGKLTWIFLYLLLTRSTQAYTSGFFTDHTFVLVEGLYGDDHVFHVYEMGFPPAEPRTTSE